MFEQHSIVSCSQRTFVELLEEPLLPCPTALVGHNKLSRSLPAHLLPSFCPLSGLGCGVALLCLWLSPELCSVIQEHLVLATNIPNCDIVLVVVDAMFFRLHTTVVLPT